jgi:large subunit ribosomal protein L33
MLNYSSEKWIDYMKEKVILVCSECLSRNYTITKNKRVNVERLELNKYCKRCGKHTLHKETK